MQDAQREHCTHQRRSFLRLTSASAVCTTRTLPDTLALAASGFVAKKRWSIEKASELGGVKVLQRVLALEDAQAHPLFNSHFFSRALVHAVKHDNVVELLECLSAYCPGGNVVAGVTEAARVETVKWIRENVPRSKLSTRERAFTQRHDARHPQLARLKDLLENGHKHLGFENPVDSKLASIWNDDPTEQ